jgi:hypothetical protein
MRAEHDPAKHLIAGEKISVAAARIVDSDIIGRAAAEFVALRSVAFGVHRRNRLHSEPTDGF